MTFGGHLIPCSVLHRSSSEGDICRSHPPPALQAPQRRAAEAAEAQATEAAEAAEAAEA
eukprot:CAMPEP_0118836396 /NCGR_PEP_ID=MMETSP1162-20130426/58406_1 /TAXON_ID=33656 /ORGANISM="Phaeocystis Sp, Strain CCMP2710" /LENGTH=58 /DNA_ID=CAMNT_0006768209 /DNA_START=51 /DNA_END=223 /DNA_ORIENTATION=+